MNCNDVRQYFIDELANERFVTSRDGQKTIELIGASFIADENAIFGVPNQKYIDAEIAWYNSLSTNVNDLALYYGSVPEAWKYSANKHGEINSNYGYLIHSFKNNLQFTNALHELRKNPDSRRATMIYTRPSIWAEYNENGKNDFICTNAVTYYIRDDKVHAVVQMRSNDVMFGYRNDYAWQKDVLQMMARGLKLPVGDITWQVQNLHVYERHFHLVK